MGLHTKHIFLSSTIREFAGKHNAICIKISFSRRWMGRGWVDRKAGLLRCLFDVGGSAGVPPGGGGVWRPRGGPRAAPRPAKQKARAGGKASGPALFRTLRVLPPPPLPLRFPPPPKRQRKSQAFRPTRPRPVHRPEKGGSDREPLRGRLQPSRRAERAFFRRGAATE